MTIEELNKIKENMLSEKSYAEGVIDGYEENYEGIDGAWEVLVLCNTMQKLIKEIETNR